MERNESNIISGLSLPSFLQLLEQEQKTCTLLVKTDRERGHLFFQEGELIDAETDREVGIEAAYSILAWHEPTFQLGEARDRVRRIDQSLTSVLMKAATRQDESGDGGTGRPSATPYQQKDADNPLLAPLVKALKKISGIRHYYVLNRQGKMVAYSEQNKKMGDFIAYCVVAGGQVRKVMDVKGPNRILITLKNGHMLLISSAAGMIFAVLINENVSADDIFARLRRSLSSPARTQGGGS